MAARIPQQFIQELLSRADIVDIIGERLPLKKAGQNYTACCPFHNEKTPSFTVSQSKQFYHCFGCGAHGSAIGFLMEYDRLEFLEAVNQLAAHVGVDVPRVAGGAPNTPDEQPLYAVLESAAKYFAAQLREPSAAHAVAYLKGRGVTGAIAQEYGIGYAPNGWDHLLQHLGPDDAARKRLLRAGLVIEKDGGGYYDRFRNRIMFPIRDQRGRTIGFGGRVLGDDTPKYLNSPETSVFHKGRELYGLFEARKRARALTQLLVVEGYMDVVGLAQFGVGNAVATLGTATTKEHIERLFRVCSDIIFCFDGDNAGRQAAWRALEAGLPLMTGHQQVRFMFLPEEEDPDSLVRKEGQEAFLSRCVTSVPFSTYLFEQLAKKADLSSIDGRARYVELARPLVSKIPPGVYREMVLSRLAEIARLDTGGTSRLLSDDAASERTAERRAPRPALKPTGPSAVRVAVKLLLNNPSIASDVNELDRLQCGDARVQLLVKLIELVHSDPHISLGRMLEYFRDQPAADYLEKVARWDWIVPEEGTKAEFFGALARIRARISEQRAQELIEKARLSGLSIDEKEELKQLLAGKAASDDPARNSARGSH